MHFKKIPESASRGERNQGRRRRLCTCLRVRVFARVARSRGARACPRAGVAGRSGPRPRLRVGPGGEGAPARVCPGAREPRSREPGAESHPSSGALQRRAGRSWAPRGAGERASPESRRSPLRRCRLLLRPAAERQLAGGSAVRLALPGPRREGEPQRETAAAAGEERRAERARGERPCPAPGALSAFLARLARSLLLPLPPRALPPPSIWGWMTEAFQTWAEPARASELRGCSDLSISHLEATLCALPSGSPPSL